MIPVCFRFGLAVACGLALPTHGQPAEVNELGHPAYREFSPGADKIGYLNQAVTQDSDGFVYLASSILLRFYDGTEWRPIAMPTESAGPRKFARAADGTIYVGGAGVIGWLRRTGTAVEFISLADQLPPTALGDDEIHDVLAAGSAVYFADEEKILRWEDGKFTVIPCRAPPHSRATHLHAVDGTVYVTSPGRPLCRIVDDRLEPVTDDPVLRDNEIVLMEPGPDGALRLLTARRGFFQLTDGHVAVWPLAANRWLTGKGILRVTRMRDGELAVIFDAPSGSGGMRFDAAGRYVGPIDETLGLWLRTFRDVFCDREGGLWLGTTEGLFRLDWPSAVTVFNATNGLGAGTVTGVERREGVLYATTAAGMFQLRPMDAAGRIARFEWAPDLVPPARSDAAGGAAGVLAECAAHDPASPGARWVARADGIGLAATDGTVRWLPKIAGLSAGKVACLWEENTTAGRVLWIGGAEGLVRVEVARAFPPPVPFGVVLTAAGVGAGERLVPKHAPLRFEYVALRVQLPNAVTYQTRLEGFERDWSDWLAERTRGFTRLPAGAYRFEVRARDLDGVVSPVAAIAFSVQPPWWLAWWAWLGYVLAGAGLVVGWVRQHTWALRQRAEKLETVVAERTAELAQQNAELARLNQLELDEKISARLAEEKARLETLRYQLNPHFLFNTLASISATLGAGQSAARAMLERLTDFCRLTLRRGGDEEWTTLGEEMKLLRAYLDIERSRWGDLLEVTIDCAPGLDGERLPHFMLLPLVENALKYGHATSADRVGVRLTARREADGTLVLEVANTGEWVDPAVKKTGASLGIGLENLRERLRRHYPRAHTLEIGPTDGWIIVRLRIQAHLFHPDGIHAAHPAD
ncbi:MAG: histidine kinase [Opitutaceae bacterium]|nr:histidine kinase [Opitutaceae bacterium]